MAEARQRLTELQNRYIWLAGSFPNHVVRQGRGKRGSPTYYAVEADVLYLFGYSNPLMWLVNRGLFKQLQDHQSYVLTEAGETEFHALLASGAGLKLNEGVKEAKLKR